MFVRAAARVDDGECQIHRDFKVAWRQKGRTLPSAHLSAIGRRPAACFSSRLNDMQARKWLSIGYAINRSYCINCALEVSPPPWCDSVSPSQAIAYDRLAPHLDQTEFDSGRDIDRCPSSSRSSRVKCMSFAAKSSVRKYDEDDLDNFVNCAPNGAVRAARLHEINDLNLPTLAADEFIESIVDGDFKVIRGAPRLVMHVLPSTTPIMVFQYRTRIGSVRSYGEELTQYGQYGTVGTVVKSGVITIIPYGSTGTVVVRLRPERASSILGENISAFANAKVDLDALFGRESISSLEAQLDDSKTSLERVTLVSNFLHARIRSDFSDKAVGEAVRTLRNDPTTRISSLAAKMDISERHLSRSFTRTVGTSPKQFSRLARFEKIMAARSVGMDWAEISYACGFNDQAHMINDVGDILGSSPERTIKILGARRKDYKIEPGQKPIFIW